MLNLSGIYPPITTPFNDDESLALNKLEDNLHQWARQPIAGVIMPGSNSESPYLSREEKIAIWQTCAAVLKPTGKRLIAGTGLESTRDTIELTVKAAELGAEAALVLPPAFFKAQMNHDALLAHYFAVADASPIPLLVYNAPAFTGVDIQPATLLALASHVRIIGAKDSSANVVKIASVLAARPDFQIFAGTASALLPFLSLGAVGGVMALANFAAVPLRRILDAFLAGNMAEAQRIQLSVAEINAAVTSRFGVSGLKYAMDCCGFYGGPSRRPLQPAAAEMRAEIDRLLAKLEYQGT